jgi:hypothetical protein
MRTAPDPLERLPDLQEQKARASQQTLTNRLSDRYCLSQERYDGVGPKPRRSWLGARNLDGKRNAHQLSPEAEDILEKIPIYSKTFTDISKRRERSYTIYPKEWILRLGIRLGVRLAVSHSLSGCRWRLELIWVVPGYSFPMAVDEHSRALVVLDHRGVHIHSKAAVVLLVSLCSMVMLLCYCWVYKHK